MTKTKQTNQTQQNQKTDSSALSYLFDGLFGEQFKDLFGGKIVHMNFDCPENLRKAFNQTVKEKGESACKILQKYMAIHVLKSTLEKLSLGTTLSKLSDLNLSVGEVRFEQYVQSRPRRFGRFVAEVKDVKGERCFYCGAGAVGFLKRLSSGGVYAVCGECMRYYLRFERDKWVVVESFDA